MALQQATTNGTASGQALREGGHRRLIRSAGHPGPLHGAGHILTQPHRHTWAGAGPSGRGQRE